MPRGGREEAEALLPRCPGLVRPRRTVNSHSHPHFTEKDFEFQASQSQDVAKPGPESRSHGLIPVPSTPRRSLQLTSLWSSDRSGGSARLAEKGAHPAPCFPARGTPGQAQVRRLLAGGYISPSWACRKRACPQSPGPPLTGSFPGQWPNWESHVPQVSTKVEEYLLKEAEV